MRCIRSKLNILRNIALLLCSLITAICIAEYTLSKITIEGLSQHKINVCDHVADVYYPLLAKELAVAIKNFKFTCGNCYPSDATGLLPLKVINPYDGNYWYCVAYDIKQRRHGYNPDRKRQVVLVGDSFTLGEGVKESDTLGYLLNEKYPKINFQNRGVTAADTDSVALQCRGIVKSGSVVDEVIYFYNLNDVRMSEKVRSEQNNIMDFQNVQWSIDEQRSSPLVKILSKSAIFSLAREVWIINRESSLTVKNYRDMYLNEINRQEFRETMDKIQSMKDMLAARGISFRVVIYPLLYKDLLGRYPFEQIHNLIISECQKHGIICLDGYVPFTSYSMKRFVVHPLDYHPNGLSNRLIVDYIDKTGFL
jgi:hypothetical protein